MPGFLDSFLPPEEAERLRQHQKEMLSPTRPATLRERLHAAIDRVLDRIAPHPTMQHWANGREDYAVKVLIEEGRRQRRRAQNR